MRVLTIYLGDIEDPGKKEWFRVTHAGGNHLDLPRIVLGGKQKDLHKVSSLYLMILEFCNEIPVELSIDVGRILQYFTHSE